MFDALSDAVDWFIDFPQTNAGSLVLFLAVLGTFLVSLMALRAARSREAPYIEFHQNWEARYDGAKFTAVGRVTVISPAAYVMASCKVWYGDVRAWQFWKRQPFQTVLESSDSHMTISNAQVLQFVTGQDVTIPSDVIAVTLAIEMRLSDGSMRRARGTVPLEVTSPEHTDEGAEETPEPGPEES